MCSGECLHSAKTHGTLDATAFASVAFKFRPVVYLANVATTAWLFSVRDPRSDSIFRHHGRYGRKRVTDFKGEISCRQPDYVTIVSNSRLHRILTRLSVPSLTSPNAPNRFASSAASVLYGKFFTSITVLLRSWAPLPPPFALELSRTEMSTPSFSKYSLFSFTKCASPRANRTAISP